MISIRHLLPAVVLGFVTWVAASTQPATAPAISFSLSSSSASIAIADAPSRNVVPLTRLAARDAFFVAYVADVPGLLECVEKSPWARGLNDPMWDKTMTVLRPKLAFLSGWDGGTFKSASGLSALDLLSCAKGDAVLFIPQFELPGKLGLDVDKMLGATKGAGAVLALRVGEEAARLRKLLTEAATKTRGEAVLVAVEQVEGATIHTVTVREKNTETGAWETTATVHYTFGGVDGGVFLATSGSKALLQASLRGWRGCRRTAVRGGRTYRTTSRRIRAMWRSAMGLRGRRWWRFSTGRRFIRVLPLLLIKKAERERTAKGGGGSGQFADSTGRACPAGVGAGCDSTCGDRRCDWRG